jgi:hypothetical protein
MRERIPDRFFARDVAMVFEQKTSMTIDPIGWSGLLACASRKKWRRGNLKETASSPPARWR